MSTPTDPETGPVEGDVPPADPSPVDPVDSVPPAEDPIVTPVTDVTDTDTGTVVVGYPPSTNTGYDVVPVVGSDGGFDPRGSDS
jgi:hypothetical protein